MAKATPKMQAALFDLDGTLYRLAPMRRRMIMELALAPLSEGAGTLKVLRMLKAFRRVREELRELGQHSEPLERLQYMEPANRLGESPAELEACISRWMYDKPLRHLLACRRDGLVSLLGDLREAGVPTGVFSDYPAEAKLKALGLEGCFDLCIAATDPTVNAFKPHPRGFLVACEAWGLPADEVLYVGDREEVDGAGARAAGMPACILGDQGDALESVRALLLGPPR